MELVLKNISKSYKNKKALDNFSLVLTNGVYGLLGPNGAGKTTLINIITGIIKADNGFIEFNGAETSVISDHLGYLPQYQNYYKNFTAKEFLKYMIALKDYKPNNTNIYIDNLLSEVNLTEQKNMKISHFSGGMKQRLGIAQTLIGDPLIIIFDEPTAGLDPKERIRFRNIISSLGKDKIIILSTHIVTDVDYIAKEIILLNNGRLIDCAPRRQFTQSIKGKVWKVETESDSITEFMNNYKISNITTNEKGFTLRIISDNKPFENAVPCPAELEDVCIYYFGDM